MCRVEISNAKAHLLRAKYAHKLAPTKTKTISQLAMFTSWENREIIVILWR